MRHHCEEPDSVLGVLTYLVAVLGVGFSSESSKKSRYQHEFQCAGAYSFGFLASSRYKCCDGRPKVVCDTLATGEVRGDMDGFGDVLLVPCDGTGQPDGCCRRTIGSQSICGSAPTFSFRLKQQSHESGRRPLVRPVLYRVSRGGLEPRLRTTRTPDRRRSAADRSRRGRTSVRSPWDL